MELPDDLRDSCDRLVNNYENWSTILAEDQSKLSILVDKFMETVETLENRGTTARLWIVYFKMVTLVKQFIEAERSGCWVLHLETIYKMLPFFHASGHLLYAKSAHLYLQNMLTLQDIMPASEFQRFTARGYFTIRRSDKFWSGIFSDQTIEQELMRRIKVFGGLVYRGLSDSSQALFVSGSIAMSAVSEEMEEFCGNLFATSEQHVDARPARTTRDNIDLQKLDSWLAQHPPFPESTELFSIASGLVADKSVNCHEADKVGEKLLESMTGQFFEGIKLRRKDRVNTFATMSRSVTINSEKVTISTQTIFHRMILTQRTNEEVAECLKYELAPYPMSLFDDSGMRKTQKSALFKEFDAPSSKNLPVGNVCEVIDGGFLLHRVTWQQDRLFGDICASYSTYISNNYQKNTIIVFDGYPEDATSSCTKIAERQRRAKGGRAADIIFDETTKFSKTTQKLFLANDRNKKNFIDLLRKHLTERGFEVKQAWEDADVDIVRTAIEVAPRFDNVIIVGEDTDLLVLLCALGKNIKNLYFRKAGRGAIAAKTYSTNSFKHKVLLEHLLFMHAFSGCDTVSAICGMGKKKIIEVMKKNMYLREGVKLFRKNNPGQNNIAAAGETVLIALYGGQERDSCIDQLRYKMFSQSGLKTKTELSRLPPTSSAARQHSLRTYHQVQKWLGEEKDALDWGWKRCDRGLEPKTTDQEPIPRILLDIISCGCTTNCGKACGCRKAGLKCSVLCKICAGETCTNIKEDADDLNDDDDDDDDDDDLPTMVPLPRASTSLKRKASRSPVVSEDEDSVDGN